MPGQTSYPDLPLQTAQSNHYLRRCLFQRFSLCCSKLLQNHSTCAKGLSFCIVFFALFALRRLVDDYELGDVSDSLCTAQNPLCVHPLPYLSFDTEAVFQALFCEVLVKLN